MTSALSLSTFRSGPQQSEAVYRFCVAVNPSDVMELDPLLGDRVLHDPLTATSLFRSVSFHWCSFNIEPALL